VPNFVNFELYPVFKEAYYGEQFKESWGKNRGYSQ